MKTGDKISLLYSGITIGLVVITTLIFLLAASNYTNDIYYHYLEEKAHALAEEKFSEDELDPVKYRNVVIRRQNSIPTSKELFVDLGNPQTAEEELSQYLDREQRTRLYANETIRFDEGDEVGIAFVYYDNTGTFAVLVLSRNPFIDDINNGLLCGLLVLVLVSAGVLYLISQLYANKVLNRIDKDYQTEKLFVNNASHEINNPLTAIQGECEVALMIDRQPAEYRDSLRRISEETSRIIVIMNELLQFSHARNGQIDKSKMQPVCLSSLLASECQHNVTLIVLQDFTIDSDAELLRIAIRNLVSNAVKYSNGKAVTVTIRRPELMIEDKGMGIPESELKKIFQPFYRASNARDVSGRGVGLALSKSILERLGADITVTSHLENGTTFKISFQQLRR